MPGGLHNLCETVFPVLSAKYDRTYSRNTKKRDRMVGNRASYEVTMTMAVAREFDPERPVVDAVRGGDRYAFEELMRRNAKWVRGVIFGVLGDADRVDDVSQQVWTSVWERASELRDTASWRSWLYRMAHNAAIDAGRETTRRRRKLREMVDEPLEVGGDHGAEKPLVQSEDGRVVMEAIQSLPAMYREPFVLRHLNGWSYQQIADLMGMPVDSIETRLVRARRFLREALKGKVV